MASKAILLTMSSGLLALSTFFFNFAILQTRSAEQYGVWSYAVGISMITFSLAVEWLRVGGIRLATTQASWIGVFSRMYFLSLLLIVVFLLPFFRFDWWGVCCLFLIFYAGHEYFLSRARIDGNDFCYSGFQIIKAVSMVIISAILLSWLSLGNSLILVVLIGIYISLLILLRPRFSAADNNGDYQGFAMFSYPFIFNAAAAIGLLYIDRLILELTAGLESVAKNAALMEILRQVIIFSLNIISIYFYRKEVLLLDEGDVGKRYLRLFFLKGAWVIAICLLSFLLFSLFDHYFMPYYFPEEYHGYWDDNWFFGFVGVCLYGVKVYMLDQFFIGIRRINVVVTTNLILISIYVSMYFCVWNIYGDANIVVCFSVAAALTLLLSSLVTVAYVREKV